jgi:hypothetical protein
MRTKEIIESRSATRGVFRRCPTCRRDVILPCVKCRAEAWLAARNAERLIEANVTTEDTER